MSGVGYGKGIGGVEVARGVFKEKDGTEDGGDLLFAGVTIACDVLFDDRGLVFSDGEVAGDGSSNGDTLGTSEFEHGLDILAEEGSFDGEVVGMEGVDDAESGFKDFPDA